MPSRSKADESYCSDGLWAFTNRFGVTTRKSEGPFDQAKSGHDALRDALAKNADKPNPRGICWGWGVIFPDIEFDVSSVSWAPELIADHSELSRQTDLGHYLRALAKWWRAQGRGHHTLADPATIVTLRQALRPDFDKLPSIGAAIDQALEAVVRLTDEQLSVLDAIDENERILCTGVRAPAKASLLSKRPVGRRLRVTAWPYFVVAQCSRRFYAAGLVTTP